MTGPLEGIRVVDFTEGWAGPFCTMELGDLGATVIKVEPRHGDVTRSLGPPFLCGESLPYLALNRSKLSITLDTDTPRGRQLAARLASSADVVVESFGPDTADELGIGYDSLCTTNPRMVYASLTPFGSSGPYRDRVGSELVMQAMTGVAISLPGGDHPIAWGGDPIALFSGKYLLHGILAAIVHSMATGEGQRVEVAMLHAAMARTMMEWPDTSGKSLGTASPDRPAQPIWAGHDRSFAVRDGRIEFNFRLNGYSPNDAGWKSFFVALGASELVDDPRFSTEADRASNFDELRTALETHLAKYTISEVMDLVMVRGGMAAPWNDLRSAHEHEQASALSMVTTMDHPLIGPLRMTSPPYSFTTTPIAVVRPPPGLGQHTIDVLIELGLERNEVEELVSERIV